MGTYETYLEEQEGRVRELESQIDMVKTRVGMTEDAEERAELRERITELDEMMDLFTGMVEELGQSGGAWEDMKESVEKAYLDVKEVLSKTSGGLIK